jgi:hypothetical protein
MKVKRIDEPGRDEDVLEDLQLGELFAFRGQPASVRQRLWNDHYLCLDDWSIIKAGPQILARGVIRLELAGTDGQTLLLRRAE